MLVLNHLTASCNLRGQRGGLWPLRCRDNVRANPPGEAAVRPQSRQRHHGL